MNVDELRSALISAIVEDSAEWQSYLLSMLAEGLTSRIRVLLSQWSNEPRIAAKLSVLNELQAAISLRLVRLPSYGESSSDETFVNSLFELARQGHCEAELTVAVSNVLSVLALRQLQFSEE